MDKIKILVVTHKQTELFSNNVYVPIQVGYAISKQDFGYLKDSTGDNISSKNPYYCELTAQYWAWKNLECEYIGLCHYRRYFEIEITENNIDDLLCKHDIILTKGLVLDNNIITSKSNALIPEDICLFYLFFKKNYPELFPHFKFFYLENNRYSPCNMFVCKKELFDQFAEWQFDILRRFENVCPQSFYSREKRLLGYISESLLSFFAYIHDLKVKKMNIVPMVGSRNLLQNQPWYIKFRNQLVFSMSGKKLRWGQDIYQGLKNDGLIENF